MSNFSDLPDDARGDPIQALFPEVAHKVSFTGTTARNSTALSINTKVVMLTATEDCFIKFGNSSVEAATTDHFLQADTPIPFATRGNTHIAAIRLTTSGDLYISELT